MKIHFCSECGTKYERIEWPRVCNSCGHERWQNPIPVASVLQPVTDGNNMGLIILQRAINPKIGAWSIPGGFMDMNDASIEDCGLRELREETGIVLPRKPKMVSSTTNHIGQVITICESYDILDVNHITIKLCRENSDYRFIWEPEELAFPIQTEAVQNWFDRQTKEKHSIYSGNTGHLSYIEVMEKLSLNRKTTT